MPGAWPAESRLCLARLVWLKAMRLHAAPPLPSICLLACVVVERLAASRATVNRCALSYLFFDAAALFSTCSSSQEKLGDGLSPAVYELRSQQGQGSAPDRVYTALLHHAVRAKVGRFSVGGAWKPGCGCMLEAGFTLQKRMLPRCSGFFA